MSPAVSGRGVDHVDGRHHEAGLLDEELGVFHVFAQRAGLLAELAEVRKDFVAHQGQHGLAAEVLEVRPPQRLLVGGEQAAEPLGRAALQPLVFLLFGAFAKIEQPGKGEEGNLFDDGQRVGDAARPEFFPELVDACFELAGDHEVTVRRSMGRGFGGPGWCAGSGMTKKCGTKKYGGDRATT